MAVGARGWRNEAWAGEYYPADLPSDWRLAYYANEFPAILVPADYWQEEDWPDVEQWREDVPDHFRVFVEVDDRMFAQGQMPRVLNSLSRLGHHLGGVVLVTEDDDACSRAIATLEGVSGVILVGGGVGRSGLLPIWRGPGSPCPCASVGVLGPQADTAPMALRRVVESFAECVSGPEGWLFAGDDLALIEDLAGMARLLGL